MLNGLDKEKGFALLKARRFFFLVKKKTKAPESGRVWRTARRIELQNMAGLNTSGGGKRLPQTRPAGDPTQAEHQASSFFADRRCLAVLAHKARNPCFPTRRVRSERHGDQIVVARANSLSFLSVSHSACPLCVFASLRAINQFLPLPRPRPPHLCVPRPRCILFCFGVGECNVHVMDGMV